MAQSNFEHKIQNRFEGYAPQPPARVWENIRAELSGEEKRSALSMLFAEHKAIIITVVTGIAAMAILLLYVFNFSDKSANHNTSPNKSIITEDSSERSKEKSKEKLKDSSKPSIGEKESSPDDNETERAIPEDTIKEKGKNNSNHPGGLPADMDTYLREMNAVSIAQVAPIKTALIAQRKSKTILYAKNSEQVISGSDQKKELMISQPSQTSGKWSFGLYATPELLMSRAPAINKHSSYSADAAVIYAFDDFFIQTGISYLSGNDNQDVNVNYLKYNHLGSYEDVYEVTFDSLSNGTVRPTYHTETVEVYDTLNKHTTTRFENDYRYLNLPVLAGYRTTISNNLTLSVKGGPIISFMLEDNRKIMFNQANTDIVGMNTPDKMVETNWQALISAGVEYHISKGMHLAIEPRFKYYFNPVYNTNKAINTKKPYSMGVRTGLVFDF